MNESTRREFLKTSALAGGASLVAPRLCATASARTTHLASFRFDVTPPLGHSLCGGWIKPVLAVDDPLEAIGFVILGAGAPIVICAVDWTGILNEAHVAWRTALAEAADTTPDRVAVQCVHQHNAPFVCFDAERMLSEQPDLPPVFDRDFHRRCLDAARAAVSAALPKARAVTHVAHGSARIESVASNRRMARAADGSVTKMRGSSCTDAALIALPEGPVDPRLRTVAFFDRGKKVAACHYYATHPMSFYGDGRVTADFCGLARKRRQQDEPDCTHIYFTGCAGDIAAGKYNDGSPAARARLTERMYRGLVASEEDLRPEPLGDVAWRTTEITLQPNPALGAAADLEKLMGTKPAAAALRMRPAFKLALLRRCERQAAVALSALHVNDISLLHLPAEPFVEYQLRAQALRPDRFVATAAYGDGGPWYLPTRAEFPFGGYEVEHAFCAPATADRLMEAMARLLA